MDIVPFRAVYDISVLLGGEEATYPGDAPYTKRMISAIGNGDSYNLSTLRLSAHSGTHIDAPAHFIENAKTLDMYAPERFILPAQVIAVEGRDFIKPYVLDDINIEKGEALLFKTHNSISGLARKGIFSKSFVYVSGETAELCIALGVSMVGIDYVSIERYGDDAAPVHQKLLRNDVLVLEGIDLRGVPEGRYTLLSLPLKVKDSEAAPARALLVR